MHLKSQISLNKCQFFGHYYLARYIELTDLNENFYIATNCSNIPNLLFLDFNMSQLDQLANLITNILQSTDEAARKKAEATLVNLRTDRPNELIAAFMAILESDYKTELRNFSASQLRLNLSNFSPATYTNLWNKVSKETQEIVKVKLFEIIYKEKDLTMQKYIADTLGEIAGSAIGSEGVSWPEFKNHVYTLFQDANISSNLAAFYILESFFSFAPEYFKDDSNDLYSLFRNSFNHENEKLKIAALRSFSSYLEALETKHHEKFQEIIIPLFTAVYDLIKNNSNEEGLEVLSEMIDIEPKFFKKKLKELNELLQNIFKMPNIESGVKRMATEMLVDYAEKYPALFRKKKDILQNVIEMIFYHMVDISSEIDPEWMSPKEGYNEDMEDDEDFETTRFGMGAIDRLIYSVGEEETMVLLSATIQTLLSSGDWRYKYTAVMALSQVGEYIEEAEKISSIMAMIIQFLRDQNPMLRYSACHAIGQISDDMQPKFQERYGAEILPELINLLSDSVPRVVSHSAAALTNFLQGMKFQQVESSLQPMMNMLLQHTSNGISLVKESCLSAISSVVEISKEQFQPFLESTVNLMFSFFETEKYQAKEYKQLKGQSIETLTIIASSVGGKMFQPVAEKLIELMIHMQQSQFEQTDPQKTYILAGWQRLCLVYGKELSTYLDRILPSLFKLVENVINNELKVVNDPEPKIDEKKDLKDLKDENINTFETEEAEVAISMLNVFIEQLKELYGPYVEKTVELLCTIIKDHPNDDVKTEACKCLPSLITAIKVTNATVAVQLARHFMSTLVSTIEREFDSDIMIVELETLKSVIQELDLCFLSQDEVKGFSEKMLNLLKSSDDKKSSSANLFNASEVDEEEKEIIGEEIKQEEEVQVAISELIGILFKTHKEMTVELAKYLINNILPSAFKEGQSEIMNKFGIFLIDDMIEYLGYEILSNEWFQFGTILARFSQEKGCVLRQAACYGLGIFAEKTPANALNAQGLQGYLDNLVNAIKIPKGTEKEKSYGHCKDNGVAALGKFIKHHNETLDLTQYVAGWFSFLPLRHDKPEAIVQHELLCDIVLNKDVWILGSDNNSRLQNIVRVLAVFGDLLSNTKIYNETVKGKIKAYLLSVNQNDLFKANLQNIWGSLNDKQRKNLEAVANQ